MNIMLVSGRIVGKKVHNTDFLEHTLSVDRVVKVVKSGRKFSFRSLVVIGNKSGCVGIGMGKSINPTEAKRKAINNAKKNLYSIVLSRGTIPHEVNAKFCASNVIIRPAKAGSGIIAGGAMRLILECLGVKNVVAKALGSTNPHAVSIATLKALLNLKSPKYYKIIRQLSEQECETDSQNVDCISDDSSAV